eukprot:TRINITY_DN7099_c0_g1_i4.p1 TRINITY_DN7099_c0_g1~~TRINITY_DN7099_c0_g1_i4.p1  ORF type:complete len:349 (+),score=86.46 TRINITY_DN7099_c0_g1_i4:86-1132(+)
MCIRDRFEVLGTGGCAPLGGEDFATVLMLHVLSQLEQANELFPEHSAARAALRAACSQAKIELSTEVSSEVLLEDPPIKHTLTRATLETVCAQLVSRCVQAVEHTLDGAGVSVSSVEECVLVGGGTRMPVVQSSLREWFHSREAYIELCTSVNADEAVAYGAAVRGAILGGVSQGLLKGVMMLDALPWSVGLEEADGSFRPVLAQHARLPCRNTMDFKVQWEQERLLIDVFEGDAPVARDNQWVKEFEFGLPPVHPETVSESEELCRTVPITFDMSETGMLRVSLFQGEDDVWGEDSVWTSPKALSMYCGLMFVMYVVLHLCFGDMMPNSGQLQVGMQVGVSGPDPEF